MMVSAPGIIAAVAQIAEPVGHSLLLLRAGTIANNNAPTANIINRKTEMDMMVLLSMQSISPCNNEHHDDHEPYDDKWDDRDDIDWISDIGNGYITCSNLIWSQYRRHQPVCVARIKQCCECKHRKHDYNDNKYGYNHF
jgi:hypothetical protein